MSPAVGTLEEFAAAIRSFPTTDDVVIDCSPDAVRCARRSIRQDGLCLVGEVHGVAENPLVIERLVNELGVEIVRWNGLADSNSR